MKPLITALLFATLSLTAYAKAEDKIAREIERIELSAEIGKMVGPDQAWRFGSMVAQKKGIHLEELTKHPRFKKNLGKIDETNARKIKAIVAKHGWPTISEYGEYTSQNAWLLVQHMDNDVDFQELILKKLEDLWQKNEIKKANYAYLYDRVQVNRGRLQRYGSQGTCVGDKWEPKPMEAPEEVDKRRAEMEMSTMAEYKKMFNCIP